MGDSTITFNSNFRRIGNENNWKEISVGENHTLAIKKDGSLWTWGYNGFGQLGDRTYFDKNVPIRIGKENDWQSIFTGRSNSFAIKKDGSLWAWGSNPYGQLGDGTNKDRIVPSQIGLDYDWKEIYAGGSNTYGIKKDGSLWAWGRINIGFLDNGNNIDIYIPTKVGLDNNWVQVTTGSGFTLALKAPTTSIENNTPLNTKNCKISPNPVGEDLKLEIMAELFSEKNIIEINNILGEKVLTRTEFKLNEGENQISLNVKDLATGTYSIQLNGKNISVFIKE